MKSSARILLIIACCAAWSSLAQVPLTQSTEPAKIFNPSTMIWKENAAVLLGDPAKPGPFVVRLRMIDALVIPPHWHPEDENITVIDGVFLMGMGDKVDTSAMKEMPAGSFATMPKGMHHFVSCRGATVVQLHGMGPLVFKWVNPEDDPDRKNK
jgi:quercetin dioxygenase-like cupin family protein